MIIANMLVGLVLLILGEKPFWLFVAAIGFIGASDATARYFSGLPDWQTLIVATLAGLLGAFLAIFFQIQGPHLFLKPFKRASSLP